MWRFSRSVQFKCIDADVKKKKKISFNKSHFSIATWNLTSSILRTLYDIYEIHTAQSIIRAITRREEYLKCAQRLDSMIDSIIMSFLNKHENPSSVIILVNSMRTLMWANFSILAHFHKTWKLPIWKVAVKSWRAIKIMVILFEINIFMLILM